MLMITMDLRAGEPSQYMWHVGEPFPLVPSKVESVLDAFLDGDELELARERDPELISQRKRTWHAADVEEAQHVVRILMERPV